MKRLGWLAAAAGLALASGCTGPRVDRGHFQLASLKGHVALVNVWATWCGPCRQELPGVVQVAQEFAPRGVTFVALNQDASSLDAPYLKAFLAKAPAGLAEHVAVGGPGVFEKLGVTALPTTVVFDKQGKVRARFVGTVSAPRLRAALVRALE